MSSGGNGLSSGGKFSVDSGLLDCSKVSIGTELSKGLLPISPLLNLFSGP